jgi:hypothetical protein
MEKFISPQSKKDLRKIGIYQIVSASIGVIVFVRSNYDMTIWTPGIIILILIFFLLFGFSIFCGYQCIKLTEKALTLSFINQGMQLVGLSIVGYAFIYAPGPYLSVTVDITEGVGFAFKASISALQISFNTASNVIAIDLNLVALFIFLWLGKINKRVKIEQESALFE